MKTTTQGVDRPAVPPLTRPELGLAGVGALAAAGVGALGLISSFDAVSAAAARWGFGEPWMVPVGMDVSIPVFSVANLLLIRMDMALAWVRFVPWVLTLAHLHHQLAERRRPRGGGVPPGRELAGGGAPPLRGLHRRTRGAEQPEDREVHGLG